MLSDIEKALNESFKDLFYNNFMWLVIIAVATMVIFILYASTHSSGNSNKFDELNQKIDRLEKRIDSISTKVKDNALDLDKTTLEEIASDIKELKKQIH